MRVFVTGATGFIGSRIVPELIGAGHQVLGLARSDPGAQSLAAAGAQVQRGDLEDLESLRSGAAASDAVLHVAFRHDWTKFAESCELDKRAIEAIGDVFQGSSRPFIVSSGVGMAQGRAATEDDPPLSSPSLPRVSEVTAIALWERGVHASVMRLPQVHNTEKQGLVPPNCYSTREGSLSGYRRWTQSLACCACMGCCPALPARAGEGHSGSPVPRSRRRGCAVERHCHRHRPRPERAGHFYLAGTGPGAFRLLRLLRWAGRSYFQYADPSKAGLEPDWS